MDPNRNPIYDDDFERAALKAEAYSAAEPTSTYASAQHRGQAYVVGTVTVVSPPPAHRQTAAPPVAAQPRNQVIDAGRRARPLHGRWIDSICDWPANLFPSCYCACCVCCGIYITAQMAQKTGYWNFRSVLFAFAFACFVGFIAQLIVGAAMIVWIPMFFSFFTALALRLHVVRSEQITECPCFGEFLIGCFCWGCSVAQMARHLYGYRQVLDGDADPDRADIYQV